MNEKFAFSNLMPLILAMRSKALVLVISHVGCETKRIEIGINGDTYKEINMEHHIEELLEVKISGNVYESLSSVIELLTEATEGLIFASKGEARRLIQGGGVSINKQKILTPDAPVDFLLLKNKYILAQKGKKNYYLVIVEG